MKLLMVVIIAFCSDPSFGQKAISAAPIKINRPVCPNLFKYQPMVFIDSIRVTNDILTTIDQNNIEEVNIVRSGYDSISKTDGKIYIFMKKGKSIKLYDFSSFLLKSVSNTTKPILLMVNSDFVNDYLNFILDKNTIALVEIDDGEDINPIKKIFPNNTIVNILTKDFLNKNRVTQNL